MIDKDRLLKELKSHIKSEYETQKRAAIAWNKSQAYVSSVVNGNKPVPEWMAKELGYEPVKTISYRFKKAENDQAKKCRLEVGG